MMDVPYSDRCARLDYLGLAGTSWQTPAAHRIDGETILRISREQGLEGIVAKRLDSRYEPGQRTGAWIKIKNFDTRTFTVGGFIEAENGGVEAILVGHRNRDALHFAGGVEFGGFSAITPALRTLRQKECPFTQPLRSRGAVYVQPRVDIIVKYLASSPPGALRHATYVGPADAKRLMTVG